MSSVTVDVSRCIRCASCSTLAPEVLAVDRRGARVLRQPDSAVERTLAHAASINCPTQAIQAADVAPGAGTTPDGVAVGLHDRLFDEAERVRWRMEDVPFDRIDRDLVTPALVELVTQIAYSELTTYTATRRFLTDFADDVDFTQWISVWFYEESKHPAVLLRWLAELGVVPDDAFIRRGRATAPFMRSKMGTLVSNVISEMSASAGYVNLMKNVAEPVLKLIARNLAGDEARHAASFWLYARRHLERAADAEAERRDALKILYLWFNDNDRVGHPVSEFYARVDRNRDAAAAVRELDLGGILRAPERMFQMIGALVGTALASTEDLLRTLHSTDPKGQPYNEAT